ncbi:MAG: zinc-ribbon domain-containing protein [Candidatus Helarchaeota archaeon]
MTPPNKVCPFCGRNIRKTDKFCPFCGKRVLDIKRKTVSKTQTVQKPPQQAPPKPTPQEKPEPKKIEDEKIPDNILAQLELRSKIELINDELHEIREKIEQLALKLTNDDTEGVENEVKELSDKINQLKAEKKDLESNLIDLPFEELKNKRSEIDARIAKLQNAFSLGEVSENAYNKLRNEYDDQIRSIENKFNEQKVKINIWIRNMRLERDKMIENLELLKARHLAGEFSDAEYNKKKDTLNYNIKKLEMNIKALNKYL